MGTPPEGSTWRVNFYVMDTQRGGGQRAVGWSPPLEGDFHVPARFGRVRMAGSAPADVAAGVPVLQIAPGLERPIQEELRRALRDLPPPRQPVR
jgi:hypothetical protein